jgi:very-short-patch-repair endonuclease
MTGAIAARQLGVLDRRQARWAGLTTRQIDVRLASGAWVRLYPAVYRLDGTPETWHQKLVALQHWARRGYAFSHRCAAALWGFTRFDDGEPIELVTTRNLRVDPPAIIHQVPHLHRRDIASIGQFRVTSATRTLLDLAATAPWPDVRAAIDQALIRRWTTLDRLDVALQHQRLSLEPVHDLIRDYRGGDAPAESELEARVLELFENNGLPRPQKQRAILVAGKLRRMDFYVPNTRLFIEADGYAHHWAVEQQERDKRRDNALAARGYVVLHWTWRSIQQRPEELIWEALQVIAARWAQPTEPAPSASAS